MNWWTKTTGWLQTILNRRIPHDYPKWWQWKRQSLKWKSPPSPQSPPKRGCNRGIVSHQKFDRCKSNFWGCLEKQCLRKRPNRSDVVGRQYVFHPSGFGIEWGPRILSGYGHPSYVSSFTLPCKSGSGRSPFLTRSLLIQITVCNAKNTFNKVCCPIVSEHR